MKRTRKYLERMTHPAVHTADELLRLNMPGKCTELIRGMLVVREPPGFVHGRVAMKLANANAIANHVNERRPGLVLAAKTGFKLASSPDTVLPGFACLLVELF